MGKTVRELLQNIDSSELTEWMAFERLEPFSNILQDYYHARLYNLIVSIAPKKGKRQTYKAENFMLSDYESLFGKPKKQAPEDIGAMLRSIAVPIKRKEKKKRIKK